MLQKYTLQCRITTMATCNIAMLAYLKFSICDQVHVCDQVSCRGVWGVGVVVYHNLMRVSKVDVGHELGVLRVYTELRKLSTVYE